MDPAQIFLELFHHHRREVTELFKGRTLSSVELAIKHAVDDVYSFFKLHPDTCLVQSDKGNKTCLMLCLDYRDKMQAYIDKSLSEGVYVMASDAHLRVAISAFIRLRGDMKKILDHTPWTSRIPKKLYDNLMSTRVSAATVPILYGMVKCHKAGAPMRPICSTLHWLSRPIQKIFLFILRDYFADRLCPENVVRIDEVARDIASLRLRTGYCFVKFDIKNMYGSLDKEKIEKMLKTFLNSSDITSRSIVSAEMVLRLLHYSLQLSTLVSYGGVNYKQTKGLPQGACDSGFLATLYLDTILQVHNEELFLVHKVTRFWKYMDDMLLYMPYKHVYFFKKTFERITSLELDIEMQEDVTGGPLYDLGVRSTISFLDIRISVMENGSLATSAYRKPSSSSRMIHALSTTINDYKMNTLTQYLQKILRRSSNEFLLYDFYALYSRALENCYPSSLLDHLYQKVLEDERVLLLEGHCYLGLRTQLLLARVEIITQLSCTLQCGSAELVQDLREKYVALSPHSRVVFPYRSVSFSRLLRLGCVYGGIPLPVYNRVNQAGYLSRFFASRRLAEVVEIVSRDTRFFNVGFVKCLTCDMVFIVSGRSKLEKLVDAELSSTDGEIVEHQVTLGHVVSPVVHRLRNIHNVDAAYTSLIYQALFNAVGVSCNHQPLLSRLPIYVRCLLGYMHGLGPYNMSIPTVPSLMGDTTDAIDMIVSSVFDDGDGVTDSELVSIVQQNESVQDESMQPLSE